MGLAFTPSRPRTFVPGQTASSQSQQPRTLSALAGTGARSEGVYDVPAVEAPKMSLSDVLNSRWARS
jgi:hypothetical protein